MVDNSKVLDKLQPPNAIRSPTNIVKIFSIMTEDTHNQDTHSQVLNNQDLFFGVSNGIRDYSICNL